MDYTALEAVTDSILSIPPFPVLFTIHAYFAMCKLKPFLKDAHWLFSLILSCIGSVAGGTLTHYMLAKSPPWLHNNQQVPTLILVWLIVYHSPFDIAFKLFNIKPIKLIIVIFENINRSRSIFSGVELAVKECPGSFPAAFLAGTLSGFGGTLITNWLAKTIRPETPSEFSKPTWSSQSAMWCAVFFYMNWDPASLFFGPLLPVKVAKLIIMTFLVTHAVTAELIGQFTPPPISILEAVFTFVTSQYSAVFEPQPAPPKKATTTETKKEL